MSKCLRKDRKNATQPLTAAPAIVESVNRGVVTILNSYTIISFCGRKRKH
jgi:hypothetical protein